MKRLLCAWIGVLVGNSVALADPTQFGIDSMWFGGDNFDQFGGGALHTFGTTSQHQGLFGDPLIYVELTSGPSAFPGWHYQLAVDVTHWQLDRFAGGFFTLDMLGVKPIGSPTPVIAAQVTNLQGIPLPGPTALTDGSSINISGPVTGLAVGGGFLVQWRQVPEPGSLGLLVVGLLGLRRRW